MPSITVTVSLNDKGTQSSVTTDSFSLTPDIVLKMKELSTVMSQAFNQGKCSQEIPEAPSPSLLPPLSSFVESPKIEAVKAKPKAKPLPGCRIPEKCFTFGQKIRHRCDDDWWVGTFTENANELGEYGIIIGENGYWYSSSDSIAQFARDHYYFMDPNYDMIMATARAWKDSECLIDGKWVSTYSLSPLN